MRNSSSFIENDTFPFQQGLFINDVHCVLLIAHELEKPFFSGCYEVVVVCMRKADKCALCELLGCRRHQLVLLNGNKPNRESRGHTDFNYMKLYTYRTLRTYA